MSTNQGDSKADATGSVLATSSSADGIGCRTDRLAVLGLINKEGTLIRAKWIDEVRAATDEDDGFASGMNAATNTEEGDSKDMTVEDTHASLKLDELVLDKAGWEDKLTTVATVLQGRYRPNRKLLVSVFESEKEYKSYHDSFVQSILDRRDREFLATLGITLK